MYTLPAPFRRCVELASSSIDKRARVGAVLMSTVAPFEIGAGYNYLPPGYDCTKCPRVTENIRSGTHLEKCFAIHAEQAAVVSALRRGYTKTPREVWTMYVARIMPPDDGDAPIPSEEPIFTCSFCSRIMYAAGVDWVMLLTKDGPALLSIGQVLRTSFEYAGAL